MCVSVCSACTYRQGVGQDLCPLLKGGFQKYTEQCQLGQSKAYAFCGALL